MLEAIRKRWAKAFGGNTFLEDLERSRRENLRHDFHQARLKAEFDLSMQKMRLEVMRMECRRAGIDPGTAVMSDEALDKAHAAHMAELNRFERALVGEPAIGEQSMGGVILKGKSLNSTDGFRSEDR